MFSVISVCLIRKTLYSRKLFAVDSSISWTSLFCWHLVTLWTCTSFTSTRLSPTSNGTIQTAAFYRESDSLWVLEFDKPTDHLRSLTTASTKIGQKSCTYCIALFHSSNILCLAGICLTIDTSWWRHWSWAVDKALPLWKPSTPFIRVSFSRGFKLFFIANVLMHIRVPVHDRITCSKQVVARAFTKCLVLRVARAIF